MFSNGVSMGDAGSVASAQEARDRRLPTRPREEIERLGSEVYERDIRPRVEADHVGEIVSIDVESGKRARGAQVLEVVDRLREQSPDALNIWSERVGHRAVASIGGGGTLRSAR